MLEVSTLAEQLLGFQEGLYSVELVIKINIIITIAHSFYNGYRRICFKPSCFRGFLLLHTCTADTSAAVTEQKFALTSFRYQIRFEVGASKYA
jgi:hypothetical protein